jgi:transcription elongation factor GreA
LIFSWGFSLLRAVRISNKQRLATILSADDGYSFCPFNAVEQFMSANGKEEPVYLTRERLVLLEQELRDLKMNGRKTMAQKIADARGHGDLTENAEYDAAKEEQQHLELKISKLESTLSRANIIEAKDLPNDKIYILSRVKLQDLKTQEHFEYLLVSPEESDYEECKISVTSPIGKALLGKTKGEVVEIKVPAGTLEYKILDINR